MGCSVRVLEKALFVKLDGRLNGINFVVVRQLKIQLKNSTCFKMLP